MKQLNPKLSAQKTGAVVGLIPDKKGKKPAAKQPTGPFNPQTYLATNGQGKTTVQAPQKHLIFSQGDTANAVFYLKTGRVKLSVLSPQGKEAVVAILSPGDFFGEGCLVGQRSCMATATALDTCKIVRIDKAAMIQVLRDETDFAKLFVSYLLSRNVRIQEDLVDHLFNSAEKRLARTLLLLAHYGKEGKPEPVIPKISQETLAEMVGTTRSRVSGFLNKFRKLGFITYKGNMEIHSSLLNVVLHD